MTALPTPDEYHDRPQRNSTCTTGMILGVVAASLVFGSFPVVAIFRAFGVPVVGFGFSFLGVPVAIAGVGVSAAALSQVRRGQATDRGKARVGLWLSVASLLAPVVGIMAIIYYAGTHGG